MIIVGSSPSVHPLIAFECRETGKAAKSFEYGKCPETGKQQNTFWLKNVTHSRRALNDLLDVLICI